MYVYTQLRDTPRTRTPSNLLEATVRPFRHPRVLAYLYSRTHPHLLDGIMHGALFSTLHAEGGARLPHGVRGNGTLAAAKMKANGSDGKSVGTLQSNQRHCAHCDNKRSASWKRERGGGGGTLHDQPRRSGDATISWPSCRWYDRHR